MRQGLDSMASNGSIMPAPYDKCVWSIGEIIIERGKLKGSEKYLSLCPPHIPCASPYELVLTSCVFRAHVIVSVVHGKFLTSSVRSASIGTLVSMVEVPKDTDLCSQAFKCR
jgi:hypothetical protein